MLCYLVEQELLTLPEHLCSPPFSSGVRVTRSLVLYICFVDRFLSFCTFSFGHCVVCSSSIYGFWLPLWYLQALHIKQIIHIENKEETNLCRFFCPLFIHVLQLDIHLSSGEGLDPINRFTPGTFVCLSHTSIWISIVLCVQCSVREDEMWLFILLILVILWPSLFRDDCIFCWYWLKWDHHCLSFLTFWFTCAHSRHTVLLHWLHLPFDILEQCGVSFGTGIPRHNNTH